MTVTNTPAFKGAHFIRGVKPLHGTFSLLRNKLNRLSLSRIFDFL
jgi:hypothetical protein